MPDVEQEFPEGLPQETEPEQEVEFGEFLQQHVGECHRYQWLLTINMAIEDMVDCFYAMAPVFIAGSPDHWRDFSNIMTSSGLNCTYEGMKDSIIPREHTKKHPHINYNECKMYNVTNSTLWDTAQETANGYCPVFDNMTLPTMDCDRMMYDNSLYTSTVVTEV